MFSRNSFHGLACVKNRFVHTQALGTIAAMYLIRLHTRNLPQESGRDSQRIFGSAILQFSY